MTRDEKITAFFKEHQHSLRWCEGGACACMGCINGSLRNDWRHIGHIDPKPITREEFDRLSPPLQQAPQPAISLSFRSHPAMNKRNEQITLLEAYSKFLESHGYLDTDWRTEAPYAIDEFLKTQKP